MYYPYHLWHSPNRYILSDNREKENYCEIINHSYETAEQKDVDPVKVLKDLRITNINRLVVAHLNINRFMSKFESWIEIIQDNIDILAISEILIRILQH